MKKGFHCFLSVGLILCTTIAFSQTRSKGPVITEYGAVYEIKETDFKTDTAKEYKAVFDIMESPDSPEKLNKSIETAARFLNMHAQSGVPTSQLKVALVVHNKASKDVITDEAYQKRYGIDNPNQKLIQGLLDAGGKIILCGQSSVSRGYPKEELIPGVQLSLSAMTALIQLQDKNYRLIKF